MSLLASKSSAEWRFIAKVCFPAQIVTYSAKYRRNGLTFRQLPWIISFHFELKNDESSEDVLIQGDDFVNYAKQDFDDAYDELGRQTLLQDPYVKEILQNVK